MQFQKILILPFVYNSTSASDGSLVFWTKLYEGDSRELNVFLQVEGRNAEETMILGRDLWSKTNGFILELCRQKRVFSSSEEICEKIIKILNRYLLSWSEEHNLDNWNDINVLIGTAGPSSVCFTRTGESHLIFWRNRQAMLADENLGRNRSPHFSSAFGEIVGGSVRLGDRFIIAPPSFTTSIGWDELTSLIAPLDLVSAFRNVVRSIEVITEPLSTSFIMGEVSHSSMKIDTVLSPLRGGVQRGEEEGVHFIEFNPLAAPVQAASSALPVKNMLKTGGGIAGKVVGKLFKVLFFPFKLLWKRISPLPTERKVALIGGLTAFVAFLAVAGYFFLQRSPVFQTADYEEMYARAESMVEEANSSLIYHDEEKARKLFWQADSLLSQASKSGEWGIKAVMLRKEVQDQLAILDKAEHISKAPLLWKITPDKGRIENVVLAGDKVYFSTSREILKGEDENSFKEVFQTDVSEELKLLLRVKDRLLWITPQDKLFLAVDTDSDNVLDKKQFELEGSISAGGVYENSVYLFEDGQIRQYGYVKGSNDLNFQKEWLKEDIKEDLKDDKVVDMAIDGQIFLITSRGKIIRLSGGKKIASSWEEPAMVPRGENLKIVTYESFENLYVLDSKYSRIVIYDKEEGKLKGQLQNDSLASAVQFDVDEKKKEIYFTDSTAVFKLNFEL